MEDERIILSGVWVSLMLTYLLGDVLRIFAGDFVAGEMDGFQVTQMMWLGMSALMLIPILMIYITLTAKYKVNRYANIIVAVSFFIFNLIGLPTYPSLFDQFLIIVGLGFNILTVWRAWRWKND
jgi:hypothetical protein